MAADLLPPHLRCHYGRFATEPDPGQLAAFFHLGDEDIELALSQATAANCLGLAVQLATVRCLGTFLTDVSAVPPGAVKYVAEQLGLEDPSVLGGYGRGGTKFRSATSTRVAPYKGRPIRDGGRLDRSVACAGSRPVGVTTAWGAGQGRLSVGCGRST